MSGSVVNIPASDGGPCDYVHFDEVIRINSSKDEVLSMADYDYKRDSDDTFMLFWILQTSVYSLEAHIGRYPAVHTTSKGWNDCSGSFGDACLRRINSTNEGSPNPSRYDITSTITIKYNLTYAIEGSINTIELGSKSIRSSVQTQSSWKGAPEGYSPGHWGGTEVTNVSLYIHPKMMLYTYSSHPVSDTAGTYPTARKIGIINISHPKLSGVLEADILENLQDPKDSSVVRGYPEFYYRMPGAIGIHEIRRKHGNISRQLNC
jgi:hypothetical protein